MVLSAQHKGNGKKMALKIAPITSTNQSSNSLKTEMGVLQKLNHDNIIKVYNSVKTQIFNNIVIMELELCWDNIAAVQKKYKRTNKCNFPDEICAKIMK